MILKNTVRKAVERAHEPIRDLEPEEFERRRKRPNTVYGSGIYSMRLRHLYPNASEDSIQKAGGALSKMYFVRILTNSTEIIRNSELEAENSMKLVIKEDRMKMISSFFRSRRS